MKERRLEYLFRRYRDNTATAEERAAFMALVRDDARREQLLALIVAEQELLESRAEWKEMDAERVTGLFEKMLADAGETPVVPLYTGRSRRPWWQWAAAAAAMVFIVFSFWFLVGRDKGGDTPVAVTPQVQDVEAPKETRAVITLADGRRVLLDSLTAMTEGGAVVTKGAEGEVSYQLQVAGYKGDEVVYNTLYNPRGSKVVSLTLSDGTKVWLNAQSSLRYPVAFVGRERRVEISGEAYFEVRSQKSEVQGRKIPFYVAADGVETEVLGTHFNVNAYGDEADIRVTLLEGSVKVSSSKGGVLIRPGEQARATADSQPETSNSVDLDAVIAWKTGWFEFDNTGLVTIMGQVSRWYDLEVVYEGRPGPQKFGGRLSRELPLSNVLRLLENNGVEFRLDNRKLIVKSR